MKITKKILNQLNEQLSGDEVAAAYMLIENNDYTVERAIEKANEVMLRQGPMIEYAKEILDDSMAEYISKIPERLQSYFNLDYEGYAYDCQLTRDLYEFDFDGKTWTCSNPHDF
jgi:hypothetical protein